jgi:hypothetical protein
MKERNRSQFITTPSALGVHPSLRRGAPLAKASPMNALTTTLAHAKSSQKSGGQTTVGTAESSGCLDDLIDFEW